MLLQAVERAEAAEAASEKAAAEATALLTEVEQLRSRADACAAAEAAARNAAAEADALRREAEQLYELAEASEAAAATAQATAAEAAALRAELDRLRTQVEASRHGDRDDAVRLAEAGDRSAVRHAAGEGGTSRALALRQASSGGKSCEEAVGAGDAAAVRELPGAWLDVDVEGTDAEALQGAPCKAGHSQVQAATSLYLAENQEGTCMLSKAQ